MPEVTYRFAQEDDCTLILRFIRELADYEKMLDQVIATEDLLHAWVFERGKAEAFFMCENGSEAGLCALLPQLLDLPRARRHLPGGPLRYAGVSWARLWQGPPAAACAH